MFDIIIIGGGIAGLYAGLKLSKKNKILVLDDRKYYGGRIHTNKKPQYKLQRKVYILLNKPKDFCTNTNINKNKKSARELIKNIKQEIVSVGNLSYQTTGLVFYTNDLELKEKLLSPTNQVKEIYSLVLNKNISEDDIKKIKECTNINNTIVRINKVERLNNKNEFGLETYMCDDDILKIIFEKINIKIIKLDRVLFGPFTKKDLPRGKWRMLNKIEVRNLKLL